MSEEGRGARAVRRPRLGAVAVARRTRSSLPLNRLRSSILLKILAALVVALVGSTAFTAFLEGELTRSALNRQSRRLTSSHLRILQQAYGERGRNLVVGLRNLAEQLNSEGLAAPERRNELIAELGTAQGNLELDLLQVLDGTGRPLEPPAEAGDRLAGPADVSSLRGATSASRLLLLRDGRYAQSAFVPIGAGPDRPILLGGHEFGDAFAYRLRGHLGDVGDVVLVARGQVAGTTLTEARTYPPAPSALKLASGVPVEVRLDGVDTLVAYQPVGGSTAGSGALGVALPDPEAVLDRSLADTRLASAALLGLVAVALAWLLFRALVRPLAGLTRTAARIAEGDLDASFAAPGTDEIARLGASLERMRLELRTQLEVIARQATDLQESSKRVVSAQDEERNRLARDLHDGIQQQLVVLRMGIGMAREAAERFPAVSAERFERLGEELDEVIRHLREVSQALYPSILVDRGLAAALHSCVGRLPVSTRLVCTPDPLPRLPPEVESAAYFLLNEALTNALKHAEASAVILRLEVGHGWLTATAEDDGRGFEVTGTERQGGLLHMADRARSFGGDIEIVSEPGRGTRVTATFPLRAPLATPASAGETSPVP